jgi:thiol-disulfide isomerase/thioredoxin
MKPVLTLILILLVPALFSQPASEIDRHSDPLVNFVGKMFFHETVAFETYCKKKSLFDLDTIYSRAKVVMMKKRDSIYYLDIINTADQLELLLLNDSVWSVRHKVKKMRLIGKGINKLAGNTLSEHFPVTLFNIDTLINNQAPYWRTVMSNEFYDLVKIDITDMPEEISDIQVEVLIKKADSLLYKSTQNAGFKNMTARYYHELNLSNYNFPASADVTLPGYLNEYEKDIPGTVTAVMQVAGADSLTKEIFIIAPELYDMEGDPFILPGEGLVFIDLWYAGCYPCMKAAPVIEKLYHEYRDIIHFFSLNEVDSDTGKIMRFKENMGITMPLILGGKEKLAVKVNNNKEYPAYFLMNATDGKVLWSLSGYRGDLEMIIRETIARYLPD